MGSRLPGSDRKIHNAATCAVVKTGIGRPGPDRAYEELVRSRGPPAVGAAVLIGIENLGQRPAREIAWRSDTPKRKSPQRRRAHHARTDRYSKGRANAYDVSTNIEGSRRVR